MDDVSKELTLLIRARYPVVYLLTFEEDRAEKTLSSIASKMKKKFVSWSVTNDSSKSHAPMKALSALEDAIQSADSAIFLFRDFHPFLKDEQVIRKTRDLVNDFARSHKTLVIVSPTMTIPAELEKDITILDLPLPNRAEIESSLNEAISFAQRNPNLSVSLNDEEKNSVVDATLGLTLTEAKRIFSKAMLTDHMFSTKDIELILSEKKQLIRKSGSLEYFEASDKLTDVGGMNTLKRWLTKRHSSFSNKARDYGLPVPKGVMLLGVQGCGKSLTAKAVASLWNQPLLRLDMGKIFSSYIGSSEENMRKAIATAESLAPVILWIDEIEKGLSGVKSGGGGDSGVTARIFGTFLSWMQEKTKPVFVLATANNIKELPPELLRKGRFDEIFFIDLPEKKERKDIFAIHVRKRKRDPKKYDLDALAEVSDGFSGAEIEMAIVESMYIAFGENREFNTGDITTALSATVPLSRTMAEDISELRSWAKERARPASEPVEEV